MIIKDIYGDTLSLTTTKLTEITGGTTGGIVQYFLRLADLHGKRKVLVQQTKPVFGYVWECRVTIARSTNCIGCREFTPKVFARIMTAAKNAKERENGKSR